MKTCSVDGCERTDYKARGLCQRHYNQQFNLGMATDQSRRVGNSTRSSVVQIVRGRRFDMWLRYERHCTDAQIEQLMQRRWRYGSFRPSFLQDGIALPETADQPRETAAA